MANIHDHIPKFHSKLNQFRLEGKYCDVTIQIQEKLFKCHRVVLSSSSEYFDAMLSGNFKESLTENVCLHDIDATAFEQILQFFYTGDVSINNDNVGHLFRISDLLNVSCIENLCIEYLEEKIPFKDAIDIFILACFRKKNSVIHLISQHIIENLDEFNKSEKFFQIPFDDLYNLFKQYWYSCDKEAVLLDTISQWVLYSQEERVKYFDKLMELVDFEYIYPEYTKTVCNKMMFADENTVRSLEYSSVNIRKNALSLHVGMSYGRKKMKLFSTDKCNGSWTVSCPVSPYPMYMNCAVVNDYLYCMETTYENDVDTNFRASSSIRMISSSLRESTSLEAPPRLLSSTESNMCSVENTIYLQINNKGEETDFGIPLFRTCLHYLCIYNYNIEVDEWDLIPLLDERYNYSYITECNNLLYLIGDTDLSGHIRAFDGRTSKWETSITLEQNFKQKYSYYSCCTHKGKIYICKGGSGMTVYDPVAGRCEIRGIKSIPECKKGFTNVKLISYMDSLYAVSCEYNKLHIKKYNENFQRWRNLPSFPVLQIDDADAKSPYILDAFIFKSLES